MKNRYWKCFFKWWKVDYPVENSQQKARYRVKKSIRSEFMWKIMQYLYSIIGDHFKVARCKTLFHTKISKNSKAAAQQMSQNTKIFTLYVVFTSFKEFSQFFLILILVQMTSNWIFQLFLSSLRWRLNYSIFSLAKFLPFSMLFPSCRSGENCAYSVSEYVYTPCSVYIVSCLHPSSRLESSKSRYYTYTFF